MPRTIDKKAEGKHIGHACEGHFRGLVQRAIKGTGLSLARELPFPFHVNPDVVVLDSNGCVRGIGIVAFWNNADNSHMKYYRSRSEYVGVNSAISTYPNHFVQNPIVSVILYGAHGGWKEQILHDFKTQCAPCYYLPGVLSPNEAAELVSTAYGIYKLHWESGKSCSREHIEVITATKPLLTGPEQKLLNLIKSLFEEQSISTSKISETAATPKYHIRLPSQHISTRYRQALGFLSLFPDSEIKAWKESGQSPISTEPVSSYAQRAHFLGLGSIVERKAIGRSFITFQPAAATRVSGGKNVYAPDLLDFSNWESIPVSTLLSVLEAHRELTRNPTSVFEGGAFDQCLGNWRGICSEAAANVPLLSAAIKGRDEAEIVRTLLKGTPVGPEAWHPAAGKAQFFPSWALAVSAVACLRNDRAIRSDFGARNQVPPLRSEAARLARELIRLPESLRLLDKASAFCSAMLSNDLRKIATTEVPDLLSPDNPSSLLKDFYNTLTTNSTHNPLNTPVRKWLESKYPDHSWHGWPRKRSVSISDVLGVRTGRRQWQFVGVSTNRRVIAAEVKSITANNWGNKSKELYDRVAEARITSKVAGVKITCIGILDGDIGKDELRELKTGIGYDEIYSIGEVLGIQ